MTGFQILRMPASIPSQFATPFARLTTLSGALPISHHSIARIGFDAPPTDPLPPLIAIDGTPRPETTPGIAPRPDGTPMALAGYEANWTLLQDLLDIPPHVARELRLDPLDLKMAEESGWLNLRSLRELLGSEDLHPQASRFFSNAFAHPAGMIRRDHLFTRLLMGEEEGLERGEFMGFAKDSFLKGVFLARMGNDAMVTAERVFLESAAAFARAELLPAAAMMYERARDVQIELGRPFEETRQSEAKMWSGELHAGDDRSFNFVYLRALSAVQVEHPGGGLLEAIFRASVSHYTRIGDHRNEAAGLLGGAWARLMKADAGEELTRDDWDTLADDLDTAALAFGKAGIEAFESMAQDIFVEADNIGSEI